MNKSLKAFLLGYLLFRCNGRYFLRYNKARAAIPPTGPAYLHGWNIWRFCSRRLSYYGWVGFYERVEPHPQV